MATAKPMNLVAETPTVLRRLLLNLYFLRLLIRFYQKEKILVPLLFVLEM